MTNHVARLYGFAAALLVFFLTWAGVAARPWSTDAKPEARDPRLAALTAREVHLRREAVRVRHVVHRRWARYRKRLAQRKREIAAAEAAQQALFAASTPSAAPAASPSAAPGTPPVVRVVTSAPPPVTSTRTS